MLVCHLFGKYQYPLQQTNDSKPELPCGFEDFKAIYLLISYGSILNSLPLLFRRLDFPFPLVFHLDHLGTNNPAHPTVTQLAELLEKRSTNPSPWALRSAKVSVDILNLPIYSTNSYHHIINIHKSLKIWILIDFVEWFNMLHLMPISSCTIFAKELCSLALDSRVCTWFFAVARFDHWDI